MNALSKFLVIVLGIACMVVAAAILLFLGRLQQAFLLDRLFWETPPLGWVAIIGILVIGGFYLLRIAFRTLYAVHR